MPSRFIALSLALVPLAACTSQDGATPPGIEPASYELPEGRVEHAHLLAEVDAAIETQAERSEAQPSSWMPLESEAASWSARARLTGQLEDLVAAEVALDAAFDRAAEGSGPWLGRASVDFSLHRFDDAGSALDALEQRAFIDDPLRAAILGQRGDLLVQGGELQAAAEMLEQAEALDPTSTSAARLGHLAWRRGNYVGAEDWYRLGLARYHGTDAAVPAWFHLQLGIMDLDRNELDDALAHFLDANAELSGYYLIEEHVAEVWTLQGRTGEALGLYLDIVERTDNPEFMDAVAGIYLDAGMGQDAAAWIDRARAGYGAQLELAPEAAYGHAIAHHVELGDPARGVELAEANFALRPNGDARAELIGAYLAADRVDEAVVEADAIAAGDWRTAPVLDAALQAYAAAGKNAPSLEAELCGLAPRVCES